MTCSTCYKAAVKACPESLVLDAGLQETTSYYWVIQTARGKIYQRLVETDGTGKLVIDTSVLPPGSLNRYSGDAILEIRDGADYVNVIELQFGEDKFTCVLVSFMDTDGVGENNHIYSQVAVPPEDAGEPVDTSCLRFTFTIEETKSITIIIDKTTATASRIEWGDDNEDAFASDDTLTGTHEYEPGTYECIVRIVDGVTAPEAPLTNAILNLYLITAPGNISTSIGKSLSRCYAMQRIQAEYCGITDLPQLPIYPGDEAMVPYEQIRIVNVKSNKLHAAECSAILELCKDAGWHVGYVDISGNPGSTILTFAGNAAKATLLTQGWTINV
jgi:hypothetical protein